MMSKCYEERRAVASEQSKLSSSLKLSKEKELREAERILKVKVFQLCRINLSLNEDILEGKGTEVTVGTSPTGISQTC